MLAKPVSELPVLEKIKDFLGKLGKKEPVVTKKMDLSTTEGRGEAVNAIARHTILELRAWSKLARDYKSFYKEDIIYGTNRGLQSWAQERYGRRLTKSEVAFIHLLSAYGSVATTPAGDTVNGMMVFDEYMRTGRATGFTDKPTPVFRAVRKGEDPDRSI